MRLRTVYYKVKNLKSAIQHFRDLGFIVKKKGIFFQRGEIHFSDGTTILLKKTDSNFLFQKVDQLNPTSFDGLRKSDFYSSITEGPYDIVLEERDYNAYRRLMELFRNTGIPAIYSENRYSDSFKKLNCREEICIPNAASFPSVSFSDYPEKNADIRHPNGVIGIEKITYATNPGYLEAFHEFFDNPVMEWKIGEGIESITMRDNLNQPICLTTESI